MTKQIIVNFLTEEEFNLKDNDYLIENAVHCSRYMEYIERAFDHVIYMANLRGDNAAQELYFHTANEVVATVIRAVFIEKKMSADFQLVLEYDNQRYVFDDDGCLEIYPDCLNY